MPGGDDEIISSWKESFGEEPSAPIRTSLKLLTKHNPANEIIDAVRITATKFHITTETYCFIYVCVIINNKRLERILPDKAAEKHEFNKAMLALQDYWTKQPRGTHYLNKLTVQTWLRYCSVDEIKAVMDVAGGYCEVDPIVWTKFRPPLDGVAG